MYGANGLGLPRQIVVLESNDRCCIKISGSFNGNEENQE